MSDAIVVLVDGEDAAASGAWSWGVEARALHVKAGGASVGDALGQALDRGASAVVVQGNDRFLGRVIAAHIKHYAGHRTPLRLYPLPVGGGEVARQLGGESEIKQSARRVIKGVRKGSLERVMLPTLRVVSSAAPAAEYGFRLGMGLVYEVSEARARGGLSAAAQLARLGASAARPGETRDAAPWRAVLDGAPLATPRALMVSALPRGWFDVPLSERGGARIWMANSEAELLASAARGRAPLALLRGEAPRLGVLQCDGLTHYLLDEELRVTQGSQVLHVEPGPTIPMWR